MITVFTPVYNRAYIIGQLYNSLLGQTCNDFEWLIIDDGSEDRIEDLVYSWIEENNAPFEIRFYRQKNGGKHRAINTAVHLAKGDSFFIVDSDDFLTNDAIQTIKNWWKDVFNDVRFAGISGLKADIKGNIIGGIPLFDEYVDATNLQRTEFGLDCDKSEVYKTSILKKYPFPEFQGETFITENIVWDRIAYYGFKIRWFNKVTYICDYRKDGLTNMGQKIYTDNPKGWGLYIHQCKKFGRTGSRSYYLEKLNYYSMLRNKYTDEQFMDSLQINKAEFGQLTKYIDYTIRHIGKRIAIYGLGYRGQFLTRLFEDTPIIIEYVLDQHKKNNKFPQLSLEDNLWKVDAIIVTPKKEQKEIIAALQKRTNNRVVPYEEWVNIIIC